MSFYHYIYYRVYKLYEKNKSCDEIDRKLSATFSVASLFAMNVATILELLSDFEYINIGHIGYIPFVIIGFIYLYIIEKIMNIEKLKKRYENEDKYKEKKRGITIILYAIVSAILMILALLYRDYEFYSLS